MKNIREIKFRAWDKKERRMVEDKDISRDTDGKWYIWDLDDNSQDYNFTLMQYTGLKDKNGKEIYEGDIVWFVPDLENNVLKYEINHPYIKGKLISNRWYYIDFSYGAFRSRPIKGGGMIYNIGGYKNSGQWLEIIGNIYENPDLVIHN